MRGLRGTSEAGRRRIIRKLHLRWWHITADQMKHVFRCASQPKEILDMVDDIVDTCPVCRTWARPLPKSIATASVATKFNDQVEADLLFFKKFIIFHMIDRGIRWHATQEVKSKDMETLIEAIDKIWVSIHGPMREFIIDGETALAKGWLPREYFKEKGINVIIKPPGSHAKYIARRGALTRDVLHRVMIQLEKDGITGIPFPQVLGEVTFSGNALLTVNKSTPYNALYGRVPNILPDIDDFMPSDATPGSIRHSALLREPCVQRMVEGTAQDRIQRALGIRTIPSAQELYKEGDLVDFYRPPTTKDLDGRCANCFNGGSYAWEHQGAT